MAVLQDGTSSSTALLLAPVAEVLAAERDHAARPESTGFVWSPEAVHCLELLTTAYQGRPDRPHELVRPLVEELVVLAWERGSISDRKFALDCLPLLSEPVRQKYIDLAFAGPSDWLRRTALRDCATLETLSPSVQASIRRLLITRLAEPWSGAESHALNVDLQRLSVADDLVALRRIIDRTPRRVGWMATVSAAVAVIGFRKDAPWHLIGVPVLTATVPVILFWIFQASEPLSYGRGRNLPHRVLIRKERVARTLETRNMLRSLSSLALWPIGYALLILVGGSLGWRDADWPTRSVECVALLLASHALLWGPSVLYAVHQGRSARELRDTGLVLAVPYALIQEARSVEGWLKDLAWSRWAGHLLGSAISGAAVFGVFRLLQAIAPVLVTIISKAWIVLMVLVWAVSMFFLVKLPIVNLAQEIPRRRRLDRAFQSGSAGGPSFFSALFELREAGEAADYVRRVRNVPRGEPLRLDRRTLRQCIALLQGGAADEPGVTIPPNGIRCLHRWWGSTELLDELGRLDEQLRAR